MQETELRLDLLKFFDELDESIMRGQYDKAREDIQEYKEYLENTTNIEADDSQSLELL